MTVTDVLTTVGRSLKNVAAGGLTTEYRANFLGIFVGVARWLGSPD